MKVSHHAFSGTGDQKVLQPDKPLCFLLDERKGGQDEEKKKPKKEGKKGKPKKKDQQVPTFKNFGALLNVAKLKGVSKMVIGWRMRPGHSELFNRIHFWNLRLCWGGVGPPSKVGFSRWLQDFGTNPPDLLSSWQLVARAKQRSSHGLMM